MNTSQLRILEKQGEVLVDVILYCKKKQKTLQVLYLEQAVAIDEQITGLDVPAKMRSIVIWKKLKSHIELLIAIKSVI